MLSQTRLVEIRSRIAGQGEDDPAQWREDCAALLGEVERLAGFVQEFSANVEGKLSELEVDMGRLESENERLRRVTDSTYFERDACVGLICRMAMMLGMRVGKGRFEVAQEGGDGARATQLQSRVVVDLPSGQVSWDYLESEAHLFDWLPEYEAPLVDQSIRDVYRKVMNPELAQIAATPSSAPASPMDV